MQTLQIQNDIKLLCRKASSFPAGVMAAFQFIEKANPAFSTRTFYGLSQGSKEGGIDYWAAVELRNNSEKTEELEIKTIPAGTYAYIEVKDFRKNIAAIGEAFKELLQHPQMHEQSFCVEKYSNNDQVKCMLRLKV